MVVTLLALFIALLSGLLVLSGLRMVLRDTVELVIGALQRSDDRARILAFAGLWLLIFCLALI